MRLLIDTHVFLWAFLEPERLSTDASRELESLDNEIFISPISVWECLVLSEKGRIRLLPDGETWVRARLQDLKPKVAHLTIEVAIRSRSVKLPHGDPADRFLAATSIVHELVLMTADERLLSGSEYSTYPCR